mmetsp:Transcript_66380/g.100069  ORF Transcript_66380/g.100069 Transcript_66380/m.100069 type:complete len:247 (+) Transcript_66380:2386-3126(+)
MVISFGLMTKLIRSCKLLLALLLLILFTSQLLGCLTTVPVLLSLLLLPLLQQQLQFHPLLLQVLQQPEHQLEQQPEQQQLLHLLLQLFLLLLLLQVLQLLLWALVLLLHQQLPEPLLFRIRKPLLQLRHLRILLQKLCFLQMLHLLLHQHQRHPFPCHQARLLPFLSVQQQQQPYQIVPQYRFHSVQRLVLPLHVPQQYQKRLLFLHPTSCMDHHQILQDLQNMKKILIKMKMSLLSAVPLGNGLR